MIPGVSDSYSSQRPALSQDPNAVLQVDPVRAAAMLRQAIAPPAPTSFHDYASTLLPDAAMNVGAIASELAKGPPGAAAPPVAAPTAVPSSAEAAVRHPMDNPNGVMADAYAPGMRDAMNARAKALGLTTRTLASGIPGAPDRTLYTGQLKDGSTYFGDGPAYAEKRNAVYDATGGRMVNGGENYGLDSPQARDTAARARLAGANDAYGGGTLGPSDPGYTNARPMQAGMRRSMTFNPTQGDFADLTHHSDAEDAAMAHQNLQRNVAAYNLNQQFALQPHSLTDVIARDKAAAEIGKSAAETRAMDFDHSVPGAATAALREGKMSPADFTRTLGERAAASGLVTPDSQQLDAADKGQLAAQLNAPSFFHNWPGFSDQFQPADLEGAQITPYTSIFGNPLVNITKNGVTHTRRADGATDAIAGINRRKMLKSEAMQRLGTGQ